MRDAAAILADMRQTRRRLIELGREYAQAVYARQLVKAPARWHGHALEALKAEYEGTPRTLSDLAKRHHTSAGNISNLAKQHGWVRRALHLRNDPRAYRPALQTAA